MPLPKTNSKGFELIEELGSGAFSVLYVARDRESNKEVAIKMEKQDKSRSVLIAEY
jgi:serine/threonine protein kinase